MTKCLEANICRVAIVGAGQIARQHAACLGEIQGVQLVAICDRSRAKAECMAERYKVDNWYTDYEKMLEEVSPQVVHVTTPPQSHFELAMSALNSGANVFVEKPLVVSKEQMVQLQQRKQDLGLFVMEDYNYLFNPEVKKLLSLLDAKVLGKVTHVDVCFYLGLAAGSGFSDRNVPHPTAELPGGAVFDFLSHMAYLALAFAGSPDQVYTHWLPPSVESGLVCDEFRASLICGDTTVSLGFSARTQPNTFAVRLYGENGSVEIDLLEPYFSSSLKKGGSPALAALHHGISRSRSHFRSAYAGLWQRLANSPGPYRGMWMLIQDTYVAFQSERIMPIDFGRIVAVNNLVHRLVANAPPTISKGL